MHELVSVIIPSFNRKRVLCDCIDSVLAQEYRPLEIIVVDDNSQDGTVEYLSSQYKDLIIIASNRRYGPSHLRNRGLNRANGAYVLFLDSDVILHDVNIIAKMTQRLSDDKTIGQIGGEIPIYLGISDEAYGRKLNYFGNNSVVVSRRVDKTHVKSKDCDYLATCNCMVRKEVADQAGGFDPYYQFGGEDIDFGRAIRNNGYRNIVDYDVAALHKHEPSGRYEDQTYRYIVTRIRYNLKWHSRKKNILIFLRDFGDALLFYILLCPKIILKTIAGDNLVRANFMGGYYILKAYAQNIWSSPSIYETCVRNYLSTETMNKFEAFFERES
ncbi:MAG: glycosyltransferase family 2 protein [Nitrospiraceae bacterium]|nr:glycosyltransferase family 2 protein [Nitrospiraceae bacterium]